MEEANKRAQNRKLFLPSTLNGKRGRKEEEEDTNYIKISLNQKVQFNRILRHDAIILVYFKIDVHFSATRNREYLCLVLKIDSFAHTKTFLL